MPTELPLLLVLLLLAAAMAGAFARLLRLPAVPMQVLFGVLLAHGPSAVVDARAVALLQPAASVALCVVALALGLRLAAPGHAFPPARPAVVRHVLAECAVVPAFVWLALVGGAGVPAQVALLVGFMALGSVGDLADALSRRAGIPRPAAAWAHAMAAIARADLAASLALAMLAVFALRPAFDPPAVAHGIELPFAACCLGLGLSLGSAAPGLVARLATPTARLSGFALAVCGTLAGATILPALLPRALFIATLAVLARLLGKWAATAWSRRRAGAAEGTSLHVGFALAPGGLVGVALILSVRHEPSLAGFADMFLAVGVWIAALNASLGPLLARAALRATLGATLSPAAPPGAPLDTPPSR